MALLSVPLIGFAAVAVDVAAMYADKQQLQTGADAAALAIAQDCAKSGCGDTTATARDLVLANKNDRQAREPDVSITGNQVRVVASSDRQHWFAPVLGFDQSRVGAESTVGWGPPSGDTAVLPLTFSKCAFDQWTNGGQPSASEITLLFKDPATGCTGPSGTNMPGGFGWLATDSGTCHTTSTAVDDPATSEDEATLTTSTGNSVPSSCTSADFTALQNATALLPVFDRAYDTGSNAYYHVYGYAAFKITGYYFADSKYRWNSTCSGTQRCVHGYFTEFVDLSDAFDYGASAPDMGASVVSLLPDSP